MKHYSKQRCIECAANEGLEYETHCMLGFTPDNSIFGGLCPEPSTYKELQVIAQAIGLNHGNCVTTE